MTTPRGQVVVPDRSAIALLLATVFSPLRRLREAGTQPASRGAQPVEVHAVLDSTSKPPFLSLSISAIIAPTLCYTRANLGLASIA